MSLDKKSILIKVSTHRGSFVENDKKVATEIAIQKNADLNMGKFTKELFTKEDVSGLKKVMNKIFPLVHGFTLPWEDGGLRLLPIDLYQTVEEKLRELNSEIDLAKDEWKSNYFIKKEAAKRRLGDLYSELSYIPVDQFLEKFSFEISYYPVPTEKDFRVETSKEIIDNLKSNLEKHSEQVLKDSTQNLWNRVINVLDKIKDRLGIENYYDEEKRKEVKPRLYSSILDNARDIIEILPALNLTNDIDLENIRQQMEKDFAELNIQDLKDNEDLRKDTADKADKILDSIKEII